MMRDCQDPMHLTIRPDLAVPKEEHVRIVRCDSVLNDLDFDYILCEHILNPICDMI